MFHVHSGSSADEVWLKTASMFGVDQLPTSTSSRAGPARDMGHVGLVVSDPRQRWVFSRQPALNPAFALAEVVWILRGRNDSAFLNYFNSQLPRYAGSGDSYDGAYGYRLRFHLGMDQLERAYLALNGSKDSRQVVLQIWDSRCDLPGTDGSPASTDVPCNLVASLKIRDDRLEWTQVMRSSDLFLGLPHNFVQFMTLQEIFAGWLEVDMGSFYLVTDSLHVYEKNLAAVQASGTPPAHKNEDSLMLGRTDSDHVFRDIELSVERIIDPCTDEQELVKLAKGTSLPQEYANILYVLVAEGLRRRKSHDLASEVASLCANPALGQLWRNWLARLYQTSI